MNREQTIKAIERTIENTKAWRCLYLEVDSVILDHVKPRLAIAIVDSMEIDRGNFILSCVEKEIKASTASKIFQTLTTDIIKIRNNL